VLVVLAGGLWYGWSYTQSRYYVGVDDANQVAIYQGVPGKIVGLRLSSVYRTTDLSLGELTSADQALVKQTIPVGSLNDANQAVDKLRIDQAGGAQAGCAPSPSSSASASTPPPSPFASPGAPTGSATPTGPGQAKTPPRGSPHPSAPGPTTAPSPSASSPIPPVSAAPSPSPSC
jgi:protein phosphatase